MIIRIYLDYPEHGRFMEDDPYTPNDLFQFRIVWTTTWQPNEFGVIWTLYCFSVNKPPIASLFLFKILQKQTCTHYTIQYTIKLFIAHEGEGQDSELYVQTITCYNYTCGGYISWNGKFNERK